MDSKIKTSALFLILAFCISLTGAPIVFGAIQPDDNAEIGAQLIESKIDFLVSSLADEIERSGRTDMVISDDLLSYIQKWITAASSPDVPVYQDVKETGQLHNSGDPVEANLKLNETIKQIFGLIIEHENLSPETLAAVQELLVLLDLDPEAFSASGFMLRASGMNKETTREQYEQMSETTPQGDFEYYGKPYDLHTDFHPDDRGFLIPSETPVDTSSYDIYSLLPSELGGSGDSAPPVLCVGYGGYYDTSYSGAEDRNMINTLIREHSWNIAPQRASIGTPASAKIKLYNNINEHNPEDAGTFSDDWIAFDWYQDPRAISEWAGDTLEDMLVFMSPGTGEPNSNHPGEWSTSNNRDWDAGQGDLTGHAHYDTPISYGTDLYTAMTNFRFYHNESLSSADINIMLDTAFVFRPYLFDECGDYEKTESRYTISLIPRNLVVDQASLDMAIDGAIDDMDMLTRIDNGNPDFPHSYPGEYIPGDFNSGDWTGYEHGIQTVGQNSDGEPELFVSYLNGMLGPYYTLNMLNRDGFLAYTTQVEEDRMNAEIIDRAHNRNEMINRVNDAVDSALGYSEIRARDAAFEEMADAQAGRVFKDHNGNWVRTQQYILRTDDHTVQLLSLSLRGGDSAQAGFSAMDFTTKIWEDSPKGLPSDLRTLPWSDWLHTQYREQPAPNGLERNDLPNDVVKFVITDPLEARLESMYVEFTNPVGDSLRESRTFSNILVNGGQLDIKGEMLTVNGTEEYASFGIASSPGQFTYNIDGRDDINVAFYEIDDYGNGVGQSDETFQDIWDALRVNEVDMSGSVAHDIGASSLEIVLSDSNKNSPAFKPIDVIYIPMSRMLWKDKETVDNSDIM